MSPFARRVQYGIAFLPFLLPAPGLAAGLPQEASQKVQSELKFVSDPETIFVNIDKDALVAWVKPVFAVLDSYFVRETKPRTVVVDVTLHPDRPADVIVAGRPALTDAETKAVLKPAEAARSPRTRVVDATFQIIARINGGSTDQLGNLTPPIQTVGNRKLAQFRPASTAEKLALMRRWARTEALPLLAAFALHRTHQGDEAIRKLGKAGRCREAGRARRCCGIGREKPRLLARDEQSPDRRPSRSRCVGHASSGQRRIPASQGDR